MTKYEFIENIWNNAFFETLEQMTIEDARMDMEIFRREPEWDVPEDLTPEEYMDAINTLIVENRTRNITKNQRSG